MAPLPSDPEGADSLVMVGAKWEIERPEFDGYLPDLLKLIERCDFVALDFEFAGVGRDPKRGHVPMNRKPSLAERYQEQRASAESYRIMQMGICPVKWDSKGSRGPIYDARPFNFFVAPHVQRNLCSYDRACLYSARAIDFHLKNGFDFNRLYMRGCLYLGHQEEAHIQGLKRQRDEDDVTIIDPKPEDEPMLDEVRADIVAWIKAREDDPCKFLNIDRPEGYNGYQRRLIRQFIRREYPEYIGIWYDNHLQVVPFNEDREKNVAKKKEEDFQKALKAQRGVRLLIDKIMELKKPIVGHNLFTDLIYMHHMFIGELPEDINDFRTFLQQNFSLIIDTKFLAINDDPNKSGASSSLPELTLKFSNQYYPDIRDFPVMKELPHVAGYDAWCTARCFVKLASRMYIAGSRNPPPPMETAPCLDARKEEILLALTTRPPIAGHGKIIDTEIDDKAKVQIPARSSNFWKVFGNRLCVNGTIEGEFTL
ncbi:hypothetical protein TWF481_009438 [Arthrobotrys musiformis]|uniref:Uncharacterized protein n=1 Tax=Arthrobotrys musiformis TaxID=47236 RepID=A0AAV9W3P3_9PEZI